MISTWHQNLKQFEEKSQATDHLEHECLKKAHCLCFPRMEESIIFCHDDAQGTAQNSTILNSDTTVNDDTVVELMVMMFPICTASLIHPNDLIVR